MLVSSSPLGQDERLQNVMLRDPGASQAPCQCFNGLKVNQRVDELDGQLPELYLRPGHLVRRVTQQATRLFAELCPEVTPRQFAALVVLDEFNELDQKRLAQALYVDQTNVAMIIRGLQKKGYVTRKAGEDDKRRKMIGLTDKGRAALPGIRRNARKVDEALLAPLTGRERQQLIRLLSELLAPGQQE
jgi:DNA-binding MarR family transcriptional regulator